MDAVSIIIPAYNEDSVIAKSIETINNYFTNKKIDCEIIVIDDASQDHTINQVEQLAKQNVHLEKNSCNRGKGYSIKKGIALASKPIILITDADLSTPIEEFEKLMAQLEKNHIIIGSRRVLGGEIKIAQTWWKDRCGRLGNRIIKKILNLPYQDTQCGFKLIKSKHKNLFEKLNLDRWGMDFELLYLANKFNYSVAEIGVIWYNNQDSKVKPFDYIKTLVEVFKVRYYDLRGLYD
jgi:glycosyltransferase involved in cell wall biosynthesis